MITDSCWRLGRQYDCCEWNHKILTNLQLPERSINPYIHSNMQQCSWWIDSSTENDITNESSWIVTETNKLSLNLSCTHSTLCRIIPHIQDYLQTKCGIEWVLWMGSFCQGATQRLEGQHQTKQDESNTSGACGMQVGTRPFQVSYVQFLWRFP